MIKKDLSDSPRIRAAQDFSSIYKKSYRLVGSYYVLLYRAGSQPHPRLGVVASKKKVRTAVSRNRVKRIAREAFRSWQGALRAIDTVIVAKARAEQVSKKQLRQCLDKLLMQLTNF